MSGHTPWVGLAMVAALSAAHALAAWQQSRTKRSTARRTALAFADPAPPATTIPPGHGTADADDPQSQQKGTTTMVDVTALKSGAQTPLQFIETVAAEFTANPIVKSIAPMLLMLLQPTLAAALGSATAAALIVQDIESVMAGNASALETQAEAGALAAIGGWASGQDGSATGAAVLGAAAGAAGVTA